MAELGDYIKWSEMTGDFLLQLATPNEADIELARQLVVPELRPFLDAELAEPDDFVDNAAP